MTLTCHHVIHPCDVPCSKDMDDELQEVFNLAVSNGINLFDTADSYGKLWQLNPCNQGDMLSRSSSVGLLRTEPRMRTRTRMRMRTQTRMQMRLKDIAISIVDLVSTQAPQSTSVRTCVQRYQLYTYWLELQTQKSCSGCLSPWSCYMQTLTQQYRSA